VGIGLTVSLGVGVAVPQTQLVWFEHEGLRQIAAGITCIQAFPAGHGGIGG
jgi:hypothetical protein